MASLRCVLLSLVSIGALDLPIGPDGAPRAITAEPVVFCDSQGFSQSSPDSSQA